MVKFEGLKIVILLILVCAVPSIAYSSTSDETNISYPKTIVLVNEYIDNIPQPPNTVSSQIESKFINQKFDIVDNTQIKRLIERDVELYSSPDRKPIAQATLTSGGMTGEWNGVIYSFKDPDKVARLARGIGSDVLVLSTAICNFKEASQPYGVTAYTYEAQIDLKAVSADSGRVLAVDTFRGIGRDSGRKTAADKALQAALDTLPDAFIENIAKTWGNKDQGKTRIELICYNATFEKSKELRKEMLTIKGIKHITEKSLIDNVLELEIEMSEGVENFADSLSELNNPKIEITSKAADRIYLKFH